MSDPLSDAEEPAALIHSSVERCAHASGTKW